MQSAALTGATDFCERVTEFFARIDAHRVGAGAFTVIVLAPASDEAMKKWVAYGLALLAVAVVAAWLSGYPAVAKYLLRWALPAFIVVAVFLRGFYK